MVDMISHPSSHPSLAGFAEQFGADRRLVRKVRFPNTLRIRGNFPGARTTAHAMTTFCAAAATASVPGQRWRLVSEHLLPELSSSSSVGQTSWSRRPVARGRSLGQTRRDPHQSRRLAPVIQNIVFQSGPSPGPCGSLPGGCVGIVLLSASHSVLCIFVQKMLVHTTCHWFCHASPAAFDPARHFPGNFSRA